ncbi:MAG: bifunctional 5,10-methylenetetrahydrofolate dehydrogenase/5,10-methenyltetrahydrofolate cyclohydrolase [Candidatus Ratteibacteria bacterium]
MPATILSGKEIAATIKNRVTEHLHAFKEQGITPNIAAIQVGDNPSSSIYLKAQRNHCLSVGISHQLQQIPADVSTETLAALIQRLNENPAIQGIILQMPLPAHLDASLFQSMISPVKDIEGVNPENIGKIIYGKARLAPCTALAATRLIEETGIDPYGKEMVIVGHSEIVGKPLALLWLNKFATLSVCHIATSQSGHLQSHVERAEILVVAVGKAHLIPGSWIREGAIVIDVGINRVHGTIIGDVEYETAKERASWITPVPGGVGPVTTAMLLHNIIEATKWQMSL